MTPYPAIVSMPVIHLAASHGQVQELNEILRVMSMARAKAITMNFSNREVGIFFKSMGMSLC